MKGTKSHTVIVNHFPIHIVEYVNKKRDVKLVQNGWCKRNESKSNLNKKKGEHWNWNQVITLILKWKIVHKKRQIESEIDVKINHQQNFGFASRTKADLREHCLPSIRFCDKNSNDLWFYTENHTHLQLTSTFNSLRLHQFLSVAAKLLFSLSFPIHLHEIYNFNYESIAD